MPNRVGQGSEDLMRNEAVTRECRSGTECGTFSRSVALRCAAYALPTCSSVSCFAVETAERFRVIEFWSVV